MVSVPVAAPAAVGACVVVGGCRRCARGRLLLAAGCGLLARPAVLAGSAVCARLDVGSSAAVVAAVEEAVEEERGPD